jgi:hypothetical protein
MKYARALMMGEWLRSHGRMNEVWGRPGSYFLHFKHCSCRFMGGCGTGERCQVSHGPYRTLASAFTRSYERLAEEALAEVVDRPLENQLDAGDGPEDWMAWSQVPEGAVGFRMLGKVVGWCVQDYVDEGMVTLRMGRHRHWLKGFWPESGEGLRAVSERVAPEVRDLFLDWTVGLDWTLRAP